MLNAQEKYTLNLKFNEKYFFSNFFLNKTENEFVHDLIKETDSITMYNNKNYIEVMDSIMNRKINFSMEELNKLSFKKRKELDTLKIQLQNGSFLELMKQSVDAFSDKNFLKKKFEDNGIDSLEILKPSYNRITINFTSKKYLEVAKNLLKKNSISFHESIDNDELENIYKCFMNKNKPLVDNFSLKKENNYLLISYDSEIVKQTKIFSKCFDSNNIVTLIKEGGFSDVYWKLYFVKNSGELENSISKSIKSFDLEFKKNEQSYDDNIFYIKIFLDEIGKKNLKKFSKKNIGKSIFISNNSQFLLNPKISYTLDKGSFMLSGNMFSDNWQETFDLLKFEVFKNSITIQ